MRAALTAFRPSLPLLLIFLACGCADLPARQTRASAVTMPAVVAMESVPRANLTPALHIPGPARAPEKELARVLEMDEGRAALAPPTADPDPQVTALPALVPAPPPEASPKEEENPANRPREDPLVKMKALHQRAAERYAAMDSYHMRLRRREVVNGSARPEEIILVKIRKEPFSVYLKWVGPEGKGREVVYVKDRHDNLIHTLTAPGDVLLLPGGKRFKVAPDSLLVRGKSRYPITSAGVGSAIDRFGALVSAVEKGDYRKGTLKYLGALKKPEFDTPVEGVMQIIPPGADPLLPGGGQRLWFFDPTLHLPCLILAQDENGREVEYYCHDRFQFPVGLDDDDFNPDKLWGKN